MPGAIHKAKSSKKRRKYGRNASYCQHYKNSNRRERNKVVKLTKHLAIFSNDYVAKNALAACKKILGNA